MKTIEIKTTCDMTLSTQTVTPYINDGKIKKICPGEFCLLIEGEVHTDGYRVELCEPVTIDREGAMQLVKELTEFINTPF
ncbi:MAG: hypothetical protein LBK58_11605 [Prevotellaceae bacterium]|jgi:hypothetical protein|nr:hypothetical protein [Prevotellaceae bacterium]